MGVSSAFLLTFCRENQEIDAEETPQKLSIDKLSINLPAKNRQCHIRLSRYICRVNSSNQWIFTIHKPYWDPFAEHPTQVTHSCIKWIHFSFATENICTFSLVEMGARMTKGPEIFVGFINIPDARATPGRIGKKKKKKKKKHLGEIATEQWHGLTWCSSSSLSCFERRTRIQKLFLVCQIQVALCSILESEEVSLAKLCFSVLQNTAHPLPSQGLWVKFSLAPCWRWGFRKRLNNCASCLPSQELCINVPNRGVSEQWCCHLDNTGPLFWAVWLCFLHITIDSLSTKRKLQRKLKPNVT